LLTLITSKALANIEGLDPQSWIICYDTARLGSIPKMIPSIALCNIKYQPQLLSSANIGLVCVKLTSKRSHYTFEPLSIYMYHTTM
jgi:hypothetical protein